MTERKRSKAEERSYAALLHEIEELEKWTELGTSTNLDWWLGTEA